MKLIVSSLFMLWCNTISVVDAFAFSSPISSSSIFARQSSSSRLYETVKEEVNTLIRNTTVYGDTVADENFRYSASVTAGRSSVSSSQISELVESIEKLTEISKRQVELIEAQQIQLNERSRNEAAAIESQGDAFERSTVRLDGLEVYAVVSALTVASSIACLDANGDFYANEKSLEGDYGSQFLYYSFLLFNAVGILTGLHATLIFSLVTVYGRTAVGLGRDSSFQTFFAQTDSQRYRGFQTFLCSFYAVVVQCCITIVRRLLPYSDINVKYAALGIIAVIVSPIFYDTNSVIEKALVIFKNQKEKRNSESSLIAPPAKIMNEDPTRNMFWGVGSETDVRNKVNPPQDVEDVGEKL